MQRLPVPTSPLASTKRAVDTVIVTGAETDVCVLSTVLSAVGTRLPDGSGGALFVVLRTSARRAPDDLSNPLSPSKSISFGWLTFRIYGATRSKRLPGTRMEIPRFSGVKSMGGRDG